MAFAGLWESWMGPNGEEMETAAIVTTTANAQLTPLHHRMPVIVQPEAFDLWLDHRNADAEEAAQLIAPALDGLLEVYPVSDAVGRVANDRPELIEPVAALTEAEAEDVAPKPRKSAKAKIDDGQASLF